MADNIKCSVCGIGSGSSGGNCPWCNSEITSSFFSKHTRESLGATSPDRSSSMGSKPAGSFSTEKPKTIRLYRAESLPEKKSNLPDWVKEDPEYKKAKEVSGRWFADSKEEAEWYQNNIYPEGRIVHVDIPAEDLELYRVSNVENKKGGKSTAENPRAYSLRPDKEFFLPRELAETKIETPSGIEKERYEKSQSSLPTDVFSGNVKTPLHKVQNTGKTTIKEDDKRGREQTTQDELPVLSKSEIDRYQKMSAHDRKILATQFGDVVEDSKKRRTYHEPSREYLIEISRQKAHLEFLTELNQQESKGDSLSKFAEGGQIEKQPRTLKVDTYGRDDIKESDQFFKHVTVNPTAEGIRRQLKSFGGVVKGLFVNGELVVWDSDGEEGEEDIFHESMAKAFGLKSPPLDSSIMMFHHQGIDDAVIDQRSAENKETKEWAENNGFQFLSQGGEVQSLEEGTKPRRIPPSSGNKVLRALRKLGYSLDRVSGSHHILTKDDAPSINLPIHKGRDVHPGLLARVLEEASIPRNDFLQHLKKGGEVLSEGIFVPPPPLVDDPGLREHLYNLSLAARLKEIEERKKRILADKNLRNEPTTIISSAPKNKGQGLIGKFFNSFLDPLVAFPAYTALSATLTGMKHIFGWKGGGQIPEGTSRQEQLRSLVAEKTEELISQFDSRKEGTKQSWLSKIAEKLDWSKYGTKSGGVPSSITGAVIGAPSAFGIGLLGTALGSTNALTDPIFATTVGAGVGALYPFLRHPVESIQLGAKAGMSWLKNAFKPKKPIAEIPPGEPVSEYDQRFNDLYASMKLLGKSPNEVIGSNPPEKVLEYLNNMADKADSLGIPSDVFWTTNWGKFSPEEEVPTAFSIPDFKQVDQLQVLGRAAIYDADKYGPNRKTNKQLFDIGTHTFQQGLAVAVKGYTDAGDIESAKKVAFKNMQFGWMLNAYALQHKEALIEYQNRPFAEEQGPSLQEYQRKALAGYEPFGGKRIVRDEYQRKALAGYEPFGGKRTIVDEKSESEPSVIDKFKKGKRFKPDFREEVIDLFDSGVSLSLIASNFEVPKAPIQGILKRAKRLEEGGQIDLAYGGQIHLLNDGRIVPTSGGIVGGGGNTDQDQGISLKKDTIVLSKKARELEQHNVPTMQFAKGGESQKTQPVALMPGEEVILPHEIDQRGGTDYLLGLNAAARSMEDGGEIQNLARGTSGPGDIDPKMTEDEAKKLLGSGQVPPPKDPPSVSTASEEPDDESKLNKLMKKLREAQKTKNQPKIKSFTNTIIEEGNKYLLKLLEREKKTNKNFNEGDIDLPLIHNIIENFDPEGVNSGTGKKNDIEKYLRGAFSGAVKASFTKRQVVDHSTAGFSDLEEAEKRLGVSDASDAMLLETMNEIAEERKIKKRYTLAEIKRIRQAKAVHNPGSTTPTDTEGEAIDLGLSNENTAVPSDLQAESTESIRSATIDKAIESEIFGRRTEEELKNRTPEELEEEAKLLKKEIDDLVSGKSENLSFKSISDEHNRQMMVEYKKKGYTEKQWKEAEKEGKLGPLVTTPSEVEEVLRSRYTGGETENKALGKEDPQDKDLKAKFEKIEKAKRPKAEKEAEWADLALKELENISASPSGLATFVSYLRNERSARQIGLSLKKTPLEVKEGYKGVLQKVWDALPQEVPKTKVQSLLEIALKKRRQQEKLIGEVDESIRGIDEGGVRSTSKQADTGSEKKIEPSAGSGVGDSGTGGDDLGSETGDGTTTGGTGSGVLSHIELEKIRKSRYNRIHASLRSKLGRKANPAEYIQAELEERRGIPPSMKQVKKELRERAGKFPSYKKFLKSPEYQDWKSAHPYGPEQNFPMMSPEDIKEHEALQLEYDDRGLGLGLEKNRGVYSRPKTEKQLEEEKYKEIYERESKRRERVKTFTDYSLEEKQTALGRAGIDTAKIPEGMKAKQYKSLHPEDQLEIQYNKANEAKKSEVMKNLAGLSPEYLFHPGWSGGGRKDPPIDTIFGSDDEPEDSGKKKKFSYKRPKFFSKEEESLYRSLQETEQNLRATDRSAEGGEEYNDLLKERIRLLKEIEAIQERRKSQERNLFLDQLKTTEGMDRQKKLIIGGFDDRLAQSRVAKIHAGLTREYESTPAGKASQKEYYRNTGFAQPNEFEQKKAQRQIAIGASIGEFGTPMGLVIGTLKTTGLALEEFGNHFKRVFTYGAAAIGGLIASASPDAWATITGSVRLLSAVIGMQFLPLALRVAGTIQNMVFWWLDLDKTTKSNIATWITWGVGIAGAGAAVGKLGTVLAGFGSILSFSFRYPLVAAAGAIGVLLVQSGLFERFLTKVGPHFEKFIDWMGQQSSATLVLVGALGLLAPALLRVAAAGVLPNLFGSSGLGATSGLGNRLGGAAIGLGIAGHSIYQGTAGGEGFDLRPGWTGGFANTLGTVGGAALTGGMIPTPIAPYLLALGAAASIASIAVRAFADSATTSAGRVSSISGLARTPGQVEASIANIQNINRRIEELRGQPGGSTSPEMTQLLEQRRTEYDRAVRPELRRRIREAPEEYRGTLIQQQIESFGVQRTTAESGIVQRAQGLTELLQNQEPGVLQALQTGRPLTVTPMGVDDFGRSILSPREQATQTRYDELNRRIALIRNQITPESLRLATSRQYGGETRNLFTQPPTGPGFEGVQFGDARHIEELVSVLSGRDEIRTLTAAIEALTGVLRSGAAPPERPGGPSFPIGQRSQRESSYRSSLMSNFFGTGEERESLQSGSVSDVETGVIRSLRENAAFYRTRAASASNSDQAASDLQAAESMERRLAEVRMRMDAFRSTPEARQVVANDLDQAISSIRSRGSITLAGLQYPNIPQQFHRDLRETDLPALQGARDIFRTVGNIGGSSFWRRLMEQPSASGLPATAQAALDPRNVQRIGTQQPGLERERNATISAMIGLSNFQSRQIDVGGLFDLIQSEAIRAPLDQAIFIAQQKSLEELVRLAGGEAQIARNSADNLQRIADALRGGIGTAP